MPPLVEQEATELSHLGLTPSLLTQFHNQIMDSNPKSQLAKDAKLELPPGFKLEQVDRFKSKFTGTHKFKYRLKYNKIPVYGSSVIVERSDDDDRKVLFTDSAFVDQDDALKEKLPSSTPTVPPDKLSYYIEDYYIKQYQCISLEYYDLNPKLYYYFERYKNDAIDEIGRWRLVYVTDIRRNNERKFEKDDKITLFKQSEEKSLPMKARKGAVIEKTVSPDSFDYIVDAHTAEILVKLSNIRTFR